MNAVFAWLQSMITLGPIFHLYDGRTPGLMGNPVQLGALCAGALWLAAVRTRSRRGPWLGCLAVAAARRRAAALGEPDRVGCRSSVAVVVAAVSDEPASRLAVLAALVIGCVLAMAVPTGGSSSTERASSAGGLGPRVALWGDAATAIVDRPVLGYGPGRFATRGRPHFSLEVARYTGGDTQYADAHNFIVDYATTTGLVGLMLLVRLVGRERAAGAGTARGLRARGRRLDALRAAVRRTHAAGGARARREPVRHSTRPVLGCAGARRSSSRSCVVTALVGAAVGAAIVAGDVAYFDGVKGASLSAIDRADGLLPPWPEVAGRRAVIAGALRVITGKPRYLELARVAAADAVRRDPENPQFLNLAGSVAEATGHRHEADRRYGEALTRNPWSTRALFGRYRIAVTDHRYAAANVFRHRLCELGKDACAPPPKVYERELAKAAKAAKSTKVPKN